MNVSYLATAVDSAALVGRIAGLLVFPAAGLTLLILGLRKRSSSRKQAWTGYPPAPPGYPPVPQGYPPPYPAAYPPPMPMPPMPPMAPPPRKPGGTGMIVSGAVLLVLGVLTFASIVVTVAARHDRPAIGDCYTNDILNGNGPWKSSSCSNAEAVLQYAANADTAGNCPDGKRNDSSYLSAEHRGVRMCFAPNLLQGQCYVSEHDGKTVRHATCSTAGTIRIAKRVDGTTDTSKCPQHTRAVTYPEPKRLFCAERTGTST
ncbi:hypothetical protein AWC27_20700 [Mycobacterium szulgai]|uniref:Uncharacterized protein n=2 Tax=Mycobacterium szulgai TaxID=1787 RepID=A0A1X2F7D1_MYCSZ|nr:hypothetical protein [Mycobacterium szulgai]ORX14340.1 hypothetical protein AWC27_20700 [Mycobacterium szulgai]